MRWVLVVATLSFSAFIRSVDGCEHSRSTGPPAVVVMSENVYLGADALPVLRATLLGCRPCIIQKVTGLWEAVQSTNFHERADAIARQIIDNNVDLAGLQEVMLFCT